MAAINVDDLKCGKCGAVATLREGECGLCRHRVEPTCPFGADRRVLIGVMVVTGALMVTGVFWAAN